MTMNMYQELVAIPSSDRGLTIRERQLEAAAWLAEEGSEVIKAARKLHLTERDKSVHEIMKMHDHLIEESGDALWAIANLAEQLGVTLHELAMLSIQKIYRRFPERFDGRRLEDVLAEFDRAAGAQV